jgi:thiol:disulfide interchange protein DsbD
MASPGRRGSPAAGGRSALFFGAFVALLSISGPTSGQGLGNASPVPESQSSGAFDPLGALRGLGLGFGGRNDDEFLEPDRAFRASLRVEEPGSVVARWDIAESYYLYRERFKFAVKSPDGAVLGEPEFPPGRIKEDAYFGKMEVYYGAVEARIPVEGLASASRATLDLTYQGCADAGLCYPPITKTISVALDGVRAAPIAGAQTAVGGAAATRIPLAEQDRLAGALASGNVPLMLAVFFGLGLLLTFTPCVLPMIPILSSIIVGQGKSVTTGHAFRLSLTYVLAMSVTYTAAGVLAGLSGANLQVAFQSPWVLGTFAAMFAALALSMFGLYELQVPVRWQERLAALSNRQRRGTYAGVAAMGFLSALIVGPCVAAPLAGALIYIARTGDAVLGGAALFALSLGMGAPVLAIGTSAGRLLPRAGPWMTAVKGAFGVILLGVAIVLLERMLPAWVALGLWAALLIVTAIYMGVFDRLSQDATGWRRLAKGAGVVVLVHGVLVMVGAASGGDDVFRPLRGLRVGGGEVSTLAFRAVKGPTGLDAALRAAAAARQPVMLDFYADWCVSCKELERDTFSDPAVRAVLERAVLLRSDVTANDAEDQALLQRLGLFGPPAILFFGPDGRERPQYRVIGFMGPETFEGQAGRALWGAVRTAPPGDRPV